MKKQSAEGSVRVEIANDLKEARRLQQQIVRELKATSFDGREIFGIKLAIEEALVNAIRHGNRLDPAKKVHVEYRVAPERIDIRIADEGPGYDPARVPDCKSEENLHRPGGRGLLLMRHYMTEVTVLPPGNELVMSKVHINGYQHAPEPPSR
jgi:serine/threonine-protein kinase RsbW